jgi:hypothetical protein
MQQHDRLVMVDAAVAGVAWVDTGAFAELEDTAGSAEAIVEAAKEEREWLMSFIARLMISPLVMDKHTASWDFLGAHCAARFRPCPSHRPCPSQRP